MRLIADIIDGYLRIELLKLDDEGRGSVESVVEIPLETLADALRPYLKKENGNA